MEWSLLLYILNIEYIYCDTEYSSYYCVFVVACIYGIYVFMHLHAQTFTSMHAHMLVEVCRCEVDLECLLEFFSSPHFCFVLTCHCGTEGETRAIKRSNTLPKLHASPLLLFWGMVSHRTRSSPIWIEQLGGKAQRSFYTYLPLEECGAVICTFSAPILNVGMAMGGSTRLLHPN